MMANIVVATVPLTGHVQPMKLVVRALIERGHHVTWYAARTFAAGIAALGATYAPMKLADDWNDADVESALPALKGKRGLARVSVQLREMFIAPMVDQLRDLEALVGRGEVDVILADQAHLGAALFAEKHGVPFVGLGISTFVFPSIDTAPFGSARPPAKSEIDRKIYGLLTRLINRFVFRAVNRAYWAQRSVAGLPPGEQATYFEQLSPDLFLQPCTPSLEYPRSDLPPQVRFVGPLVPRASVAPDALPPWWPDILAAHAQGTPIVLVTQGTLATDPRELIRAAVRGLADEDVLVIATTGATPRAIGLAAWPANTRVAPFVPYQAALEKCAVMITNGGYGGVQMALAAGVPMVIAGGSEEKPEIAARVAWAGAGINLRTGRPWQRTVRRAVRRILGDAAMRDRCGVLAVEIAATNAPLTAATEIEHLIEQRGAHRGARKEVA